MEKQFIKELAEKVVAAALNTETLPIKSGLDYSWQDFALVSDADAEELENEGCIRVNGTIYESGSVSISINVPSTAANQDALRDAFKRIKAKNMVLCALEKKRESEEAANQADQLLTKAAGYLGIPVADIEKIVVTENEEAQL